jgi:hypothetical protein
VNHSIRFATIEVIALYPSIDLECCFNLMAWFLNTFRVEFQPEVSQLVFMLARLVLTHSYISYPEVSPSLFLQLIGT